MKKLLIATILLTLSAQSNAEFYSGNELKTKCNDSNAFEKGLCMGYIAAVIDAYSGLYICPPSNSTLGQSTDMVKKYMSDNPSQLHRSADVIVTSAMSKDFPCKKK